MAVETKLFSYFENLGGMNAIDSEEAIPDNQQMMLQNVLISKAGTIKKRKGYQKKGNTINSSSTSIDGLALYKTNVVSELMACAGGKVYRNSQKNVIVADRLEISSLADQTGGVCRATFYGTPDLSSVQVDYWITIQGASKTNNNDRFQIKAINTTSYYIDFYKTSVPADNESYAATALKPGAAVHSEDLPVVIGKLYAKLASAANYDALESTIELTFSAPHSFLVGDQLEVLVARDYAVTGVSLVNNWFVFAGADLSGIIPANHLTIYGSTANNGTYNSIFIDNTAKTITVTDVIPSAIADGRGFIRYEDYGLIVEEILSTTSVKVSGAFRDFSFEVLGTEIVYGKRTGVSLSYDWNLDGYLENIYAYPVFDYTPLSTDYVVNTKDVLRNMRVVGFEENGVWLDEKLNIRHGDAIAVESSWDVLTGDQIAKETIFDVKIPAEQDPITLTAMQDNLYSFNQNDECYRYDGSKMFRAGFHKPPEFVGAPVLSGEGSIEAGNYVYVYTYSYYDSHGLLIESQPSEASDPISWEGSNSFRITVKIPTIPKTVLNNGLNYDTTGIYINLYRTLDQGAVYYLVKTLKNDATVAFLNVEDNQSDAAIEANQVPLYTTLEGEFANDNIPIAKYAVVWDNRIWCANGLGYQEGLLQFLSTIIDHNTSDTVKISDGTNTQTFTASSPSVISSISAPLDPVIAVDSAVDHIDAPSDIEFDGAVDLTKLVRGDKLVISGSGSAANNNTFTVNSVAGQVVTVYETTLVSELASPAVGNCVRTNVAIIQAGSNQTIPAGAYIRVFNAKDKEKLPLTSVAEYDTANDYFRFTGVSLSDVKPGDVLVISGSTAGAIDGSYTVESTDEVLGRIYTVEDLTVPAPVALGNGRIAALSGRYPNNGIFFVESAVSAKPYIRIFSPFGIAQAAPQGIFYPIMDEQTKFYFSDSMDTELDVLISLAEAINSTKDCHVFAYWQNISKFQTLVLRERQRNSSPITIALDFNTTALRPTLAEVMENYKINDKALESTDNDVAKSFFKTVKAARLWYSKDGQPESFVGAFDDLNGGFYIDIDAQDGQEIMGICPSKNGLIVGKFNSHYLITAAKDNVYVATKVDSDSGCKSGYSMQQIDGSPVFLAQSGLVQTDGYSVKFIGESLFRLYKSYINKDFVVNAIGLHDHFEDRYYAAVPYSESNITSTSNNYVLCYDINKNAWSLFTNMAVRCWAKNEAEIYFGSYNGLVYQFRNDNSNRDYRDDWAAIDSKVQTKWYDLMQPTSRKMFSKVSLHLYNREQSSYATVKYAYDYSGGFSDVGTTAPISEDWGSSSFVWGISHWGTTGADAFRKALNPQKARAVKFSFENNVVNQNLEILGWEIEAKLLTPQATKQG